ncbi:MAG: AraC family transcriptional regulator ligand-binding domain-containing protein [Burkholderiaceae bacterium]
MTRLSERHALRGVHEALALLSLDSDELYQRVGINPAGVPVDDLELSDRLSALWEAAALDSRDPAIGLHAARKVHPAKVIGLLAHRTLVERTLESAVAVAVKHISKLAPSVEMSVEPDGALCRIVVRLVGRHRSVPMQRYDFAAFSMLRNFEWVTGARLAPAADEHPFPEPDDRQPYDSAYGVPVQFGMPEMVLVMSEADMKQAIPTADPGMVTLLDRLLTKVQLKIEQPISSRVRRQFHDGMHKGEPRREVIAARLAMSERTLQRRLAAEGTSYAELLDSERREAAQRLLAIGRLSPTEMSYRLGFSDPSNFYRACKRWFGQAPRQMLGPARTPQAI